MYILKSPQDLKFLTKRTGIKILVQHTSFLYYFSNKSYYNNNLELVEKSKKEIDYFVVLSEYDKEKLIEIFNFPEEKIKIIRHSSLVPILKEKKKRKKNLVMVSRLDNVTKRFDLVIKAMKNLSEFNLNIYGDGSDKEKLEKLLKEDNIINVKLKGITKNIEKILEDEGILIISSDREGYPMVAIEAMRRGLPIIVRKTFDASNDIVKENGVLLSSQWREEEFIQAVYKTYNNYDLYSTKSLELGKRYDATKIKKQWKNLIMKGESN